MTISRILRRGIIHRTVERYKRGAAFWDRCPACKCAYLRVPMGKAHTSPCPSCDSCLRAMNCIGIDQAVAIIAANRTEGAAR